MTADEIRSWLRRRVADVLRLDPRDVDPAEEFSRYGLDSESAVGLTGELEERLGRRLDPTLFYECPTIEHVVDFLCGRSDLGDAPASSEGSPEPVAIVGMACRLPGASDIEAYWALLEEGVDAVSEWPRDRWGGEEGDAGDAKGASSAHGGFLRNVDGFDARFFGISPREARQMDPQQRLVLELAWDALEDAGLPKERVAGSRTGIFVGLSHTEYGALLFGDPDRVDVYSGPGGALSVAANRLSYFFDLRGPSVAVDTACSSSLVAVDLACERLRHGECDLALAAGANVVLGPGLGRFYGRAGMLAADGRCRSFDASADGFARSEGAGLIVLKPLSHALAEGDRIYALVRGSAVNHDGRTNGLMAPSRRAQTALLREAWSRAGVEPSELAYVEAHGIGLPLADAVELKALGEALGERREGARCQVGSVKSNLGHLEAAAGIAGLIKAALALEREWLPGSLHFRAPPGYVDLESLGLAVGVEKAALPKQDGRVTAGVSAFGFGGTNAHVVLEAPPARTPHAGGNATEAVPRLLLLSDPSAEALCARADALRRRLVASGETLSLGDLVYTAAVRRSHHQQRLGIVFEGREELVEALRRAARSEPGPNELRAERPACDLEPVVFVFPEPSEAGERPAEPLMREAAFQTAYEDTLAGLRAAAPSPTPVEESRLRACASQVAMAALWRAWGVVPGGRLGRGAGAVAADLARDAIGFEEAAALLRNGSGRSVDEMEFGAAGDAMCLRMEERPRVAQADSEDVLASHATASTSVREALLRSLAALYVAGHEVDWRAVYGEAGRVISMPGRVWQRERFWLHDEANLRAARRARRTLARSSEASTEGSHPLLGRSLCSAVEPETSYWEIELRHDSLSDLCVRRPNGRVLLPAAAQLEMLLSAADEAFPSGAPMLETLELAEPLVLSERESLKLQLILAPGADGRRSAQLLSRPVSGGAWTLHARGAFGPHEENAPAGLAALEEFERLRARCTGDVDPGAREDALSAGGPGNGPSSPLFEELWKGSGEAVARLRLPEAILPSPYRIHPSLLDGAFQLAAATAGAAGTSLPSLPVSLERFRRGGGREVPSEAWVAVRLREASAAENSPVEVELALRASDGGAWAEARTVRFSGAQVPAAPTHGARKDGAQSAALSRGGSASARSASEGELLAYLAERVAEATGIAVPAEWDAGGSESLQSLGIDSIVAVEIRERIEMDLGVTLPLALLFEANSLAELVPHLKERIAERSAHVEDTDADTDTGWEEITL